MTFFSQIITNFSQTRRVFGRGQDFFGVLEFFEKYDKIRKYRRSMER